MRGYLAYLFLGIYCLALLKPILPMMEYAANEEFISTVLCLNKDKPELRCNGKCILAQKLAEAQGLNTSGFPDVAQEVEHPLSLHYFGSIHQQITPIQINFPPSLNQLLMVQFTSFPPTPPPWG